MSQIYKFRVGRERVFFGSFLTLFVPRPAQFYCVTYLTLLVPVRKSNAGRFARARLISNSCFAYFT